MPDTLTREEERLAQRLGELWWLEDNPDKSQWEVARAVVLKLRPILLPMSPTMPDTPHDLLTALATVGDGHADLCGRAYIVIKQQAAHIKALGEAVRRLSDAISDQAAVGSDGLFDANTEFDARSEYLAALKAVRAILAGEPRDADTLEPNTETLIDLATEAFYRAHVKAVYHSEKGRAKALANQDARKSWRPAVAAAVRAVLDEGAPR